MNERDVAQDVAHDAHVGPRANPTALAAPDAARLLSAASGQRVTTDMIESDVNAGAPTNADGTINLVTYAAWLAREMASGGD